MDWKKVKHPHERNREAGQAIMEFVLGLMIVISIFFFYVKLAAGFAVGNYIHYATFMSARAYMASSTDEEAQRTNAETVLEKMVGKRFKGILEAKDCPGGCADNPMAGVKGGTVGSGPYAQEDRVKNRWNQGVTYSYQVKLSLYPWNRDQEAVLMKLTSESWLSREESARETEDRLAAIAGQLGSSGMNVDVEWDNGY